MKSLPRFPQIGCFPLELEIEYRDSIDSVLFYCPNGSTGSQNCGLTRELSVDVRVYLDHLSHFVDQWDFFF